MTRWDFFFSHDPLSWGIEGVKGRRGMLSPKYAQSSAIP